MDTTNEFLVGVSGEGIRVQAPPRGSMTKDQAIRFAAWLVAMADDDELDEFKAYFDTITGS